VIPFSSEQRTIQHQWLRDKSGIGNPSLVPQSLD